MEMDFHSVVMQDPFWSHTSYCIVTRGRARELRVSLIYKSTYLIELAHPPPGAVVAHSPLHPHFLHHLAAIPHLPSLWVSQVPVSQVSAPPHIQPIQCFPLPC